MSGIKNKSILERWWGGPDYERLKAFPVTLGCCCFVIG